MIMETADLEKYDCTPVIISRSSECDFRKTHSVLDLDVVCRFRVVLHMLKRTAIRLLLVDRHQMFLESLVRALSDVEEIDVVGTARTYAAALVMAEQHEPSVAVVEARLSAPAGVVPALGIKRASPTTRVIVLCDRFGKEPVPHVDLAGASGVLTRDKGVRELVAAVKLVHGTRACGPQHREDHPTERGARAPGLELTRREAQVLHLIAVSGLQNREIALYLQLSIHTVRNYVQRVLAKLGAHSKLEAAAVARELGLLDGPPVAGG